MRNILLSLLLVALTTFSYAQQVPDGLWGIAFGSSVQQAQDIIKQKHGVEPEGNIDDYLSYKQVTFGGYVASTISLFFFKGKLYMGIVDISQSAPGKLLDEYKQIVKDFAGKYGKPTQSIEKYKYPFEKGDGHEFEAIRSGDATIGDIWHFPAGTGWDDAKTRIILGINEQAVITVTYTENELKRLADEASDKESQGDY